MKVKFKRASFLIKSQSFEGFKTKSTPLLAHQDRLCKQYMAHLWSNCITLFYNSLVWGGLSAANKELAEKIGEFREIVVGVSKAVVYFKQNLLDCLDRLNDIERYLQGLKSTPPVNASERVARGLFRRCLPQCRYIAAQYFKIEMFVSCLNATSKSFLSKMTDTRYGPNIYADLDHHTIIGSRDAINFINYRRITYLSEYLHRNISEPFRDQLEVKLTEKQSNKLMNWKHAINENLGKAYLLCKLCGESIQLSYLNIHSKLCYSSYDIREKMEGVDADLIGLCEDLDKHM